MGDADSGIGLVDVLATRAGGAEGVDADVLVVDLDLDILDLGQDRDGGGRGVDPAAGLGGRNALDAVDAAFELQPAEDALAGDGGDDLLVAAGIALGGRVQFDLPAAGGGVTGVHAEQVAGEQGRLVATGACADFQHGRGVLVGVTRGQQQGDAALHLGKGVLQNLQLIGGHLRHLGVSGHGLEIGHLGPRPRQRHDGVGDGLHLRMLFRQTDDLLAVAGRAHARLHLVEAVEHLIEPGLGQSQGESASSKREAVFTPMDTALSMQGRMTSPDRQHDLPGRLSPAACPRSSAGPPAPPAAPPAPGGGTPGRNRDGGNRSRSRRHRQ